MSSKILRTLENLRDALLMFGGGMMVVSGMILALFSGLIVPFPWSIACIVGGAIGAFVGMRLFNKGYET